MSSSVATSSAASSSKKDNDAALPFIPYIDGDEHNDLADNISRPTTTGGQSSRPESSGYIDDDDRNGNANELEETTEQHAIPTVANSKKVTDESGLVVLKTSSAADKRKKLKEKKEAASEAKKLKKWENSAEGKAELERKRKEAEEAELKRRRELLKISILSIYVSELPQSHPFTKNKPWIKCVMGNVTYTADFKDNTTAAATISLQKSDSVDNVNASTVSHNSTSKENEMSGDNCEWHKLEWIIMRARNVSDRKDLVFMVGSEDIIIGRYVFRVEEFDMIPFTESGYFEIQGIFYSGLGPAGRIKIVCFNVPADRPQKAPPIQIENIVVPPSKALPEDMIAYVKITSISLIDLKRAHIVERNSPSIALAIYSSDSITDAYWRRSTSTIMHAGSECSWDLLPWRVCLYHDSIIEVVVTSTNVSSSALLGKVSIPLTEIAAISPDEHGNISIIRFITNGEVLSGKIRIVITASPEPQLDEGGQCFDYDDKVVSKQVTEIVEAIIESQRQEGIIYDNSYEYDKQLLDMCPMLYTFTVPFKITIYSASVLDADRAHPMHTNSLYLNAACGIYGGMTDTIRRSGSNALWVGLRWEMIVNSMQSSIRFTAWSKKVAIGSVSLTALELLSIPCDFKGITNIFTMLYNNDKVVGKLKVQCRYSPYVDKNDLKQIGSFDYLPPEIALPTKMSLPVLITIDEIAAFDLKAIHTLAYNSPQVRVLCDRKTAYTKSKQWGGSMAVWPNVSWPIPLSLSSDVTFTVFSNSIEIGSYTIDASTIAATVKEDKHSRYETTANISRRGYTTGRIRISFDMRDIDDDEFKRRYEFSSRKYLIEGSEVGIPSFDKKQVKRALDDKYTIQHQPVFKEQAYSTPNVGVRRDLKFYLSIKIVEVDVTELKSVHRFKRNSPYVTCSCGKIEMISDVRAHAGMQAYWSNLDWSYAVKDDTNIFITVASSMGESSTKIGTMIVSSDNLIAGVADPVGVKRLTGYIYEGKIASGKVKIAYYLDAIRDDATHYNGNNGSGSSSSSSSSNSSRGVSKDNEIVVQSNLSLPLIGTICSVTASDLQEIHMIGSIAPYVRVICGKFVQSSTVMKPSKSGEQSKWNDLDWDVLIQDHTSVLTIQIMSHSSIIGACNVNGLDLLDYPRNREGKTVIQKLISITPETLKEELNRGVVAKEESAYSRLMKKVLGNVDVTDSNVSAKSGDAGSDGGRGSMSVPCTGKIKVMMELKPAMKRVFAADVKRAMLPLSPVKALPVLQATLAEPAAPTTGTTAAAAGAATTIATGATTATGTTTDDHDSSIVAAIIQSKQQQASSAAGILSGNTLPPIASTTTSNNHFPFKLRLKLLAAIDLRQVHTIIPNSNYCVITCDSSTYTLPVQAYSGNVAEWRTLSIPMFDVDADSYLYIEVKSKSITVGTLKLNAIKLINANTSKTGYKKVGAALLYEYKSAGKVRIDYEIVAFDDSSVDAVAVADVL